jgi:hypothetical protein
VLHLLADLQVHVAALGPELGREAGALPGFGQELARALGVVRVARVSLT